jgi:hypothetical protein
MYVSALITSIQQNITGLHAPPPLEDTGTQLNFEEEEIGFEQGTSELTLLFKLEQECGLCMYGLMGGGKAVPLILLTPENNYEFCLGCIGWDIACLMKRDSCDMAEHDKQKLNATDPSVHIMAHTTKQMKFAEYQGLFVKVSQLSQYQS